MSSTDLDAPPLSSILLAVIVVIGLHVLTAVALVAIKTPKPIPEPPKNTPPVEIQFVTLPAKTESPKTQVQAEKLPAPAKKEAPPPLKSQPKQPQKTEPEPKKPTKTPKTLEKPAESVVKKPKPKTLPVIAKEQTPFETKQKPILPKPEADTSAADEQRRLTEAQAKKSELEAHAKADQEAKRVADAKAEAQAKAAREAAAAKATKDAAAAAQARAAAEAAAQSDEPVSFTATSANWASAPNLSFPDRAARRARSGDTLNVVLVLRVNKQGGIDSVRVATSSGNPLLDKEAQRQVRSGKFKPFTNKNGAPVVGNVTLPISYTVP
ncbi:TonB family protein [Psychrobacter sp. NG27]|uniref:TonB family protein n=1 Tax=Psychrobacter sp. NG27 TaxID=2781966 RepID=UPI0018DFAB3C|nr:TonB family protein [Psychrobacter sp. NG27]MBI0426611.1 TonB family protein [Psychrobacter sp. NG27]